MKEYFHLEKFSYLLRGWVASNPSGRDPPIWRFSLENPFTGELLGFANFEELIVFLEMHLADNSSEF